MFRIRARSLFPYILLLALAGCSRDLSRSRAANLIKQHKEFGAVVDVKVPVGNIWWDWRNVNSFKPLEDRGILTVREAGQKDGMWSKEYLLELTPRGKDLSRSWLLTKDVMPSAPYLSGFCWTDSSNYHTGVPCHKASGTVYSIVLARRKLNEVTGITTDSGGKESEAEFSWEWAPTGADAKMFADRMPAAGVQKGRAAFQLYDDGWRITQIEFQ
jgi:hypothetical protein